MIKLADDKTYLSKFSFWVSLVALVWFFIPGTFLGWTIDEGYSGFEHILYNYAWVLILIPVCTGYIVFGSLFGHTSFERYAKQGVMLGILLFLIQSLLQTFTIGFYVVVGCAAYLWWESNRKAKADEAKQLP
jgi:ABC-type molybdate transport system permease subunit